MTADRGEVRPGGPGAFALVGLGGFIGGASRYVLTLLIPDSPTGVTWTTLTINVIGSFLLPVLVIFVVDACRAPTWVRPLVGTGFLGAFTTFSAYTWAIAVRSGVPQQITPHLDGVGATLPTAPMPAMVTMVVSLVAGVGAAIAGFAVARWCSDRYRRSGVDSPQSQSSGSEADA